MSPSVALENTHPRPLKRPRKASKDLETVHYVQPPQPPPHVDHIFITEGDVMKKPGGKKVRSLKSPSRLLPKSTFHSHLYLVVNAGGELNAARSGAPVEAKNIPLILRLKLKVSPRVRPLTDTFLQPIFSQCDRNFPCASCRVS